MLEAQLSGQEAAYHAVLSTLPHIGVQSNGESFLGHINQTLTGLILASSASGAQVFAQVCPELSLADARALHQRSPAWSPFPRKETAMNKLLSLLSCQPATTSTVAWPSCSW